MRLLITAIKIARAVLRRVFLTETLRRMRFGVKYFSPKLSELIRWSLKRTEGDNFYYPLSEKNYRDLAAGLGLSFRCSPKVFDGYIREILNDLEVKAHLGAWKSLRPDLIDSTLDFGRRVVWYAVARHLKPKLVVETGVHHGLGAIALCAALVKNRMEGFEGDYVGTDIDPSAGSLLSGPFSSVGKILFGDSLASIEELEGPIELFVNDSDHSFDYEMREYRAIEKKLSERAVVLGDNSHSSESLRKWSGERNRSFVLLREQPINHWYPGAGVGVSISNTPGQYLLS